MRDCVQNLSFYKVLVCCILFVLTTCMGVDLYAQTIISADQTASGPYGDVTINAGVTFTVSSEVTITGNLNNNGGTIIVGEGGVLTVERDVTNTSVDGGSTVLSTTYMIESDEVSETAYNNYEAGKNRTRSITTVSVNGSIGRITISSGGRMIVNGDVANRGGSITIASTSADNISRLNVNGTMTNESTSILTQTTKVVAERSSSSWSRYNWAEDWWNSSTDSKNFSSTITLSNGYLTIDGNLELEDNSLVSYQGTGLTTEDGLSIKSTIQVRTFDNSTGGGSVTQNEGAVLTLASRAKGSLVVQGIYTDNTISDANHPWTISNEGKLTESTGFSLYISKYKSGRLDDGLSNKTLEELHDRLDQIKDADIEEYLKVTFPVEYSNYEKSGSHNKFSKYLTDNLSIEQILTMIISNSSGIITGMGEALSWIWNSYGKFKQQIEDMLDDEKKQLTKEIGIKELIEMGVNAVLIAAQCEFISTLLPIELTYFSASENAGVVDFEWETSSEYNNDFYTIEYSRDGSSWSSLLEEDGAGTTSDVSSYVASASAQQFSGLTYFRLKQTDFNGEYSYSDVTTVAFAEEQDYYVYPNPAEDVITISGAFKSARIIDIHQRTVLVPTEAEVTVSCLPAGVYHVVLITENGKKVIPFIKK